MIAELYIVAESFENNQCFSVVEIEKKIKSLANDFIYIRKYKSTNKIFIHPDIYNVVFIKDIVLSDLLYNPQIAKENIDRDAYNALQKVIIESKTTDISSKEVIEVLLSEHNENLCHGLIGFSTIPNVKEEYQIIYNLQGWFNYRRYFLGIYPQNESFFIDECKKYFPNLFFHERNKTSITAIFDDCPKKIIYHLSALNDKFYSFDQSNMNRTEVLVKFSQISNLDSHASLEGNADRKNDFTFDFNNCDNCIEMVCCEPHLKLCYSDCSDAFSNERRIYFHEGKQHIHEGKILIGHIGKHL